MSTRNEAHLILAFGVVLGLTACNGDDSASASDSATTGETTTTGATTSASTSTSTSTGSGGESESGVTDPATLSGASESETGGCPPNTIECDEVCVDVMGDPNNCGACDMPCARGESCQDGGCVGFCDEGLSACGGACVDLDNDPENCGECGVACEFGEECVEQACVGIEVCDGVDNNSDGEIDESFPDTDMDGIADCVDLECEVEIVTPVMVEIDETCVAPDIVIDDPWNVEIEWQWKDGSYGSYNAPMVGNLTDDNEDGVIDEEDTPDVAVSVYSPASIAVLDGVTGDVKWTKTGTSGSSGVAIADVNGDGKPDVVGLDSSKRAIALDGETGELMWTSTVATTMAWPLPTVADVDADGVPEVLMGEHVVNGEDGSLARTFPLPPGIPYWGPTAADLDLDGDQEIIIGNSLYDLDGTKLWTSPVVGNYGHWTMVINADDDPEAEVGFIGGSKLAVHNHDGSLLYEINDIAMERPGPPCVADFDGDGEAEMAWGSKSIFSVYELDGTKLWSTMGISDPSGLAGCAGYDANGDGIYEILFADQHDLIFDGKTGDVLFKQPGHNSGTVFEYPTVADVDKDGSAEILYVSNGDAAWGTLTVLGHAGSGWMASGPTWGIHDFAVTNLLPGGKVPAKAEPWWQIYNVFRARPTVDDAAVDLRVEVADSCVTGCQEQSSATLVVQVFNYGGVDVDAGVPVTLFRKDGMMLEALETVVVGEVIPAGTGTAGIVFTVEIANLGADGLVVRVDDDGMGGSVQSECEESNNEAAWDNLCPG